MNKKEFLERLEKALLENMDIRQAAQHIRYYREYIENEVAKGRLEEEVIESLQSPRIIAKNIINNSESASRYDNNIKDYSSEQMNNYNFYDNAGKENERSSFGGFTFSVNGKPINSFWIKLIGILALIIIAVLVVTVISGIVWLLFKFVLPVIFVIAIVSVIIKIFTNNSK